MWEYETVEVRSSDFGSLKAMLNTMGKQGWEPVGLAQTLIPDTPTRTLFGIGILLKRRVSGDSASNTAKTHG
jgi:Domain of unknown function (DUF4177)